LLPSTTAFRISESPLDERSTKEDTSLVPAGRPISPLVVAELYDSGDASFLDSILQYRGNFKPIIGLIERWKKDSRPWARRLKIDFVLGKQLNWDCRVVFKRLFKQAWADRDHELVGACMVTLDRLLRRKRKTRYRFSRNLVETSEVLKLPIKKPKDKIFSNLTTHYLRRRAWRYFRRLGYFDPAAYLASIVGALARYTDDDVRTGENLLDNWGLMHTCFGKSPVLAFHLAPRIYEAASRDDDARHASCAFARGGIFAPGISQAE
jgi:hypothetical protein